MAVVLIGGRRRSSISPADLVAWFGGILLCHATATDDDEGEEDEEEGEGEGGETRNV